MHALSSPAMLPSINAGPVNILLVDDSHTIHEHINSSLGPYSHMMHNALNGEEGLAMLASLPVDIVLLDLNMPAMNGFSFIEHVRVTHSYQSLPIIVMTSDANAETLANVFQMGANDFIAKPIRNEEFHARFVNQLLLLQLHLDLKNKYHCLDDSLQDKKSELRHVIHELQQELVYKRDTQKQMSRYICALEHCPSSIVMCEPSGKILFKNNSARLDGALTHADVDPLFDAKQRSPRQIDTLTAAIIRSGRWHFEHQREDGGSSNWEKVEIIYLAEPEFECLLIIREDITDQKSSLLKLQEMLYTDAQCHLPNKASLQNYLLNIEATFQCSEKAFITVYCLEVDKFNSLREVHGSSFSDDLKIKVAATLTEALPAELSIYVVGDARFIIIMEHDSPSVEPEEAIHAAFSRPLYVQQKSLYITVSLGIATESLKKTECAEVVRTAEMALSRAMRDEHGCTVKFDATIEQESRRIIELEQALRRAIENDELALYYQPIVNASDHSLAYAECLLRWNHPEKGPISPAEFIPIAEKSGIIVQIGEWVTEMACQTLTKWRESCPDLCLAINLSAAQLKKNYDFFSFITSCTKRHGLPTSCIEIEVTENMFLDEVAFNTSILEKLQRAGFSLSIDDFGTGYSSLFYLSKFSFDKLKIDQHFVKNLMRSDKSGLITSSIVNVARSLNMRVTVEGVEDQSILNGLAPYDIDYLQGYHFAKPIPKDQFMQRFIEQ